MRAWKKKACWRKCGKWSGRPSLRTKANDEQRWSYFQKPAVWRVKWTSASEGMQVRYIYFHVGDFSNAEFVEALIRSMRGNLAGMFLAGISPPPSAVLPKYLEALAPGGLFVAALNYTNVEGETSTPESDQESVDFVRNFMTEVDTAPTLPGIREASPEFYFPTLYLFRRK